MVELTVGTEILIAKNNITSKHIVNNIIRQKDHSIDIQYFDRIKDNLNQISLNEMGKSIFLDYYDYFYDLEYVIKDNGSVIKIFRKLESKEELINIKCYEEHTDFKEFVSEFLKDRKLQFLYHFTNVDNIKSILENGLMSRTLLSKNNIHYLKNDSSRMDKRNDMISMSVSFPNFYVLRNYIYKNSSNHYCVIEYNINLLNDKEQDELCFYKYNAARDNGNSPHGNERIDFVNMFSHFYTKYSDYTNWINGYSQKLSIREGLPIQFPTHEQAEIMIKGKIDNKYIYRIIFKTQEDLEKVKTQINNSKVKMLVEPLYFKTRNDYMLEILSRRKS